MLKSPLGELVAGTPSECTRVLSHTVESEKPARLILVGDTVSRNAVESGMKPDVIIIDHKELRGKAVEFSYSNAKVIRTINPAGTIDLAAWQTVNDAVEEGDSAVLVEGEEDLLTLVAIVVAPRGSLVVYGQPGQGIVLVRVTEKKKDEIRSIVGAMEKVE
jgi:uncharacterized protein (UPF0218 family)